jgi:hypothetical protein
MSPPVISHSWNVLRIYAKVDTCDWTGTFYTQVIGAHLSPPGSDIKGVLGADYYDLVFHGKPPHALMLLWKIQEGIQR